MKLLDNMIMILNKLESITFSVFKFRYLFLLINLFVYKMTINQSNYSGSADFIIESSSFEINSETFSWSSDIIIEFEKSLQSLKLIRNITHIVN